MYSGTVLSRYCIGFFGVLGLGVRFLLLFLRMKKFVMGSCHVGTACERFDAEAVADADADAVLDLLDVGVGVGIRLTIYL